jgi:hypothetical protein
MKLQKLQSCQLLFICAATLILASDGRLGVPSKDVAYLDEDRDLGYYNRQYYNNYYGYKNGNNNNNNNNNNYNNNRNNNNNNRRYYNRYYRQGGNGWNDTSTDDDQVQTNDDDAANVTDNNSSSWFSAMESEVEQNFYSWYESPPGEWTTSQWAWFSGLLILTLGLVYSMCMCCISCCKGEKERSRNDSSQDFDEYTSIDSRKGSFMTKESESTDFDDNATYDSIMRLRSD